MTFNSLIRSASVASRARRLGAALMLAAGALLAGCGGSSRALIDVGPSLPQLVSITVSPATATLVIGSSQQFAATANYSDGSTALVTASATWSSSAPAVASISNALGGAGLATAATNGTTTITAKVGTLTATATLTVTGATLLTIAVTPANVNLATGATQQFTATGTYSNNSTRDLTGVVSWASSNVAVATISNAAGSVGLATAGGAGTAAISATLGGVTGSAQLSVAAVTLASISVTPANSQVTVGSTLQFTATGTYSNNTTLNLTDGVTWSSSNPALATVSNTAGTQGQAAGVTPGALTLTATLNGISGSTGLTVVAQVVPVTLVSILVTPATAAINIGGTEQYVATGTYSNGTTAVITTAVAWNSSVPTVASIGATTGLATANSAGTTQISATLGTITSAPVTLTVNPFFAYAVNFDNGGGGGSISEYSIAAAGNLQLIGTQTTVGPNPFAITLDPTGSYAYVANYTQPPTGSNVYADGSVSEYSIGANGLLTPLATPSIPTLTGPNGIVANPAAPYVYVADYNSNAISTYQIGAGGELAAFGTPVSTANGSPAALTVNAAGTHAYAAIYQTGATNVGAVLQFDIVNGALVPMTPNASVASGNNTNQVVINPAGTFAYAVNYNTGAIGSVSQYAISAVDGSLTFVANVPTDGGPLSITLDAAGQNAYVANRAANTIWQYTVDAASGALTHASTVAAAGGPTAVTLDPTGRYAYVPARYSPTLVLEFSVDAANGSLVPFAAPNQSIAAGTNPVAIVTTP